MRTATLRFPITKKVEQADGSLIVWGPCTNDSRDLDKQRVNHKWAARKLTEWQNDFGAPLRVMHDYDAPPAGKGLDVVIDPKDKVAYLRARVAQKDAIADVRSGKLRDFSIGMVDVPIFPDADAPGGMIGSDDSDDGYIAEVSLVDIGAAQGGKGCTFSIAKRASRTAPIVTDDGLSKALRRQAKKNGTNTDKEKTMDDDADTADKAADMPEGHVACGSCEGGKIKGELPCPKCKGEGHYMPKAKKSLEEKAAKAAKKAEKLAAKVAAKAAGDGATGKGDHDADGDVRDALDDLSDDVDDAQGAQAVDDATEKGGTGSVAVTPPAQTGTMKPKDMPAEAGMVKTPKVKKPKGKVPPAFLAQEGKAVDAPMDDDDDDAKCKAAPDDGDDGHKPAFPGAAKPFGKKKTAEIARKRAARVTKQREAIPYLAMRAHDVLCPCYGNKVVKAAYGDVAPETLDPEFFRSLLAERALAKAATPGSIAEITKAYETATGLQALGAKSFADISRAAHKAFLSMNPDLPNLKPGLISPDQFRRPYMAIPGREKPTSDTTTVPSPTLKPTIGAEQFDRGPLTDNQTRPTLSGGGHSVAKGRTFYTNDAKDNHATMMGDLHDFIAKEYPGCCPMADAPGTPTDSDGRMGPPAEMNAPIPPTGPVVDTKAGATITEVRDTSRANKGAGAPLEPEAVKALVRRAVKKATRGSRQEVRTLKRQIAEVAASPDPRAAVQRSQTFGAARKQGVVTDPKRLQVAREATERLRSRDSREHAEGLAMLRDAGFDAKQIAAIAVE